MIEASVRIARREFSLNLSFTADAPVTGLFGPSGAGKTTLINAIAGIERPDEGRIALHGRTLFDSARGIDVPIHLRGIGVVFQDHRLFPHYSVKGNLCYGRRTNGLEIDRVVELLEIGHLLRRRVQQLSGGERQRVALGRALLGGPELLLLDEPLASLDLRLRRQILPCLRRVRDELGTSMLYVSHDLAELLQMTDRLMIVEQGRLVGRGRYADLVHEQAALATIHDRGMRSVIPARVRAQLPEEGVSILDICADGAVGGASGHGDGARQLIARSIAAAPGTFVTVAVQPWDVALAKRAVPDVSIQNQLPGAVTRVSHHERCVLVEVDLGTPVVAEISRRSAEALGVREGGSVVCLIKSHAIERLDAP